MQLSLQSDKYGDLNRQSVCDLSRLIASGEVTPSMVTKACLDQIRLREKDVGAWSFIDEAHALEQARFLDQEPPRSVLHGIPVAIKDVIDTADMPTEMGSELYRGYRPAADAACVAILRAAGAVILGKTTTSEFAGSSAPATRNPHDLTRTPGGSSSGSAAAVADFMAPIALGTQTGGSVLRPASFCGLVGFKPTFGLINTAGVKPAAVSFDTIGLMGRCVEDIELVNSVLTNDEPTAAPLPGPPKIGLCKTPLWNTVAPETAEAVAGAAADAARAGALVKEIEWPYWLESLPKERAVINAYERRQALSHEWSSGRDRLTRQTIDVCERGANISVEQYRRAKRLVGSCRNWLNELFDGCDVLLTPCVPGVAPQGIQHTGEPGLQEVWTALHVPAMTLPAARNTARLPVGIQLVGNLYEDRRLLGIGRWFSAVLGS